MYLQAFRHPRFLHTNFGETPAGKKCYRRPDKHVRIMSEIRALGRMNISSEEYRKRLKEIK